LEKFHFAPARGQGAGGATAGIRSERIRSAVVATTATAATELRKEVRWNAEAAGEQVLVGFCRRDQGHGEVVHLVAELGLVADVFQRFGERHVAQAELVDAERARILGSAEAAGVGIEAGIT